MRAALQKASRVFPALLLLLLAGCASTPPEVAKTAEAIAPLPITNALPAAIVATAPAAPTNAPIVAIVKPAPTPPRAKLPKKDLQVKLTQGTRTATIDNTRIYLLRNAEYDNKAKKAIPSASDAKKTIAPLLTAHTQPLIQGRPMRVFIDPGHGGSDPGAASADGRHKESRLVLDIARLLEKKLEKAGFETRLSRTDHLRTQVLEERTLKANNWKADLFISIHLNANPSPEAHGIETYVLTPAGEFSTMDEKGPSTRTAPAAETGNANDTRNAQFGFAIHRRLVTATKLHDRGLRRARFAVLRGAKMPAVLVECGFLTSKRNLWFLTSKDGQEKIATALFEGICDYALGNLDANRPAYDPIKPLFAPRAISPQPRTVTYA